MKKRPLCAICILFLVIQGIRVLFFGVEEMKLSPLEKALPRESGVELTGTVYRIEEKKKVTAVFLKDNVVSSTDQTVRESKVLVYISGNQSEQSVPVRIGNRLCIRGETQTFERARNPGNFDQKTYYQRQGIHVLIWAEKISVVSDRTAPLRQFLSELKSEWNKRLVRHLGDYYGPAMSAILLGEKSGLDPEMKTMYQKCGISHLLAISGLHMTFLGMGIYNLLRRAGLGFVPSGITGAALLILYSMMIGAGVSSLRALIMFFVRIGAEITGRDYDLLTGLFLSAAVLCAWQPLYLTDAGFQLSYGAILGIALCRPVFYEMMGCNRIAEEQKVQKRKAEKQTAAFPANLPSQLREKGMALLSGTVNGLCTSLAVNVLLLGPLLWFYFEIPPYSVFLNLIVIPVMPAAVGAGVAGSALTVLSDTAGGMVLQVCRGVLYSYDRLCEWTEILPGSRFVAGKPGVLWIVLYYLALGVLRLVYSRLVYKRAQEEERGAGGGYPDQVWQRRCRVPGWGAVLLAVFMAFICRNSYQIRGEVQVTVLDVGQGDGIHIRGEFMNCLIDGGSSDIASVGTYRLEPYFLSQGIDRLDYVFVSHGDEDHISGIREMLENQKYGIEIAGLVLPPVEYHEEKIKQLARTALNNGTRVAVMEPGDAIASGGKDCLILSCIAPEKDLDVKPGNETSLVLDLAYGNFDMLFTGDAEGTGEDQMAASGRLREYDVLKVAHHGSKNSGTEKFLNLTRPSFAVISAGIDNRYGHPHADTVRRLTDAGCTVCSTQDNGAVTIESNGETMKLYGFTETLVKQGSLPL